MAIAVKMGHVETNVDPEGASRIRARIKEDGVGEVPWAFPLLPKQFQVIPKVGEGVFIFTENDNRKSSNRYYVGPIISQPQFNEKSNFSYGRGVALSALDGRRINALPNIEGDGRTEGSFPKVGEVAVVGRESQDMIMRHSDGGSDEVNIRCGIRQEDTMTKAAAKSDGIITGIGKVIFNNIDPAYIQLKYKKNLASGVENQQENAGKKVRVQSQTNSAVNLVADKINLVSNDDISNNNFGTTINDVDMEKLMSELHQLPKGDVLIKFLSLVKNAIATHTHPWANLPPYNVEYVQSMYNFSLDDILSDYIRIS